MAAKKYCYFQWVLLCSIPLLSAFVCPKDHGNAANDLLDIMNENRTAHKLPKLSDSPGLGCIALQVAQECQSNCSSNNTIHCQPPEDDFTEIFAPNCGVELPTFGTITGYIVGCRQQKYLEPPEVFSNALVKDEKSLNMLRNGTFKEAGVGIVGRRKHKGPYVWCVVFSDGETNSTFVLEDLGKGIEQKRGCYSGTSVACSAGDKNSSAALFSITWIVLLAVCFFHIKFL